MENRSIAFYTLVAIVLFGLGYGLWIGVINKGTLSVSSTAPFSLQLDQEPGVTCQTSPCEFRVKAEIHGITIRKDGYIEYVKAIDVPRGQKTEIAVELEKIVKAEKAKASVTIPSVGNPFILQTDKARGLQSLVKKSTTKDGSKDEVIAYFARPFEYPSIMTTPDASLVWIINRTSATSASAAETSIYQIAVQPKTRTLIYTTSENVRGISASQSGKAVAVILANRIDLVDTESKISLAMTARASSEKLFAWKNEKSFFYVENGSGSSLGSAFLKRAALENPGKPDVIQAWKNTDETIIQLWNDTTNSRLIVKGTGADYIVAY